MDCGVLSWRDTALRKMRIKGVKGLQVELLVAYRGHPVETAVWGIVEKEAIAIKPGQKVEIECGRGEVVKLVGPQTAWQVLDAIQRAVRADSPRKAYTGAEITAFRITDCRRCPLQGFAGVVATGTQTRDGTPQYRALWTRPFCHAGYVFCEQTDPSKLDKKRCRISHEFFLPEHAINFHQRPPPPAPAHEEAGAGLTRSPPAAALVGTPPSRLPSWWTGSAAAGLQQPREQQEAGSSSSSSTSSSSSSSSSPRKQQQEQQPQQQNGQGKGKKRLSLPSALAALLQVK